MKKPLLMLLLTMGLSLTQTSLASPSVQIRVCNSSQYLIQPLMLDVKGPIVDDWPVDWPDVKPGSCSNPVTLKLITKDIPQNYSWEIAEFKLAMDGFGLGNTISLAIKQMNGDYVVGARRIDPGCKIENNNTPKITIKCGEW